MPFNTAPTAYDEKQVKKRTSPEGLACIEDIGNLIKTYSGDDLGTAVKETITSAELGFGKVLPLLRVALCGGMQGPDLFQLIDIIGREEAADRIATAQRTWSTADS